MSNMILTALCAAVLFAVCVGGMAIGLLVRGKILRGGCTRDPVAPADGECCGACGSRREGSCQREGDEPLLDPGNPSERHSE